MSRSKIPEHWLPILALWCISRFTFWIVGIHFDLSPLNGFWQYLDEEWLKHDLFRSLFYLHSQPPLFNLLAGVILKSFSPILVAQILFLLVSLLLTISLAELFRGFRIDSRISFLLIAVFIVSPEVVLWENWFFYSLPCAAALTTATLILMKLFESPRFGRLFLFFCVLFLMCATWSLFHLVYYVGCVTFLLLNLPNVRSMVVRAALLPGIFLVLLYVKNGVVFGSFSLSSWTGMNLAKVILKNVDLSVREKLSAVAAVEPFSPLERYPKDSNAVQFDAPCLVAAYKSSGAINFNHARFVQISQHYLNDDLYCIRKYPQAFVVGEAKSWFFYFQPASEYPFPEHNKGILRFWILAYQYIICGKVPTLLIRGRGVFAFLLIGIPLLVHYGWFVARKEKSNKIKAPVLMFMCLNISYVAFIGNLFESGENNRFRFVTDPLLLLLLGLFLSQKGTLGIRSQRRRLSE